MTYVKWTFWTIVAVIVGAFLHYTLPQHDVVRVVNTYQERQDLGDWTRIFWASPEDQSSTLVNRDVQFISTVTADGKPVVFRNEDTGWGWPPYFKFDTANLQTEADDLKSSPENPKWAVVTHYGWRSEILSIFPNAVAIQPVESKDASVIPWFNIIFLTLFGMLVLTIRALWIQFRRRSIDPMMEEVADRIEDVTDRF
ncbi:uncharacterized protein DUF1523 [Rhodobacter aestuarii]|uniref:DUF1523 domain-containing protein n=1 Tax=Rhodobacter aestuarii TaxID=453582 RepID=A0A1N7NEP5_9RHOB|nr:DUF1523 family protein [Rhodobacter aestuarii]PTV96419.1 uncharacterized protein DUF1523 [Rhodobacter aestuarii]SIS96835.1 Protein of unknown function [Rhodobacter aestuarii]